MTTTSQMELLQVVDDESPTEGNYYVKYKRVADADHHNTPSGTRAHPGRKNQRRCCPLWCYRRNCVITGVVLSIVAMVVSWSIFVDFAVTSLHPHVHVANFVPGTCFVESGRYTEIVAKCGCSQSRRSCQLSYPCLEVIVRYTTEEGETHHTVLYASDDEFTYTSHCSITPHCESGSDNKAEVEAFRLKFGKKGQSFSCFHHPTGYGAVVTRLRAPLRIIHILLWPGIASVVSFLCFLFVFCHCVPKFCNKEF